MGKAKDAAEAFIRGIPDDKLKGFLDNAGTLFKDQDFRLDMQGVQINNETHISTLKRAKGKTISTVLVPVDEEWTPELIKRGFAQEELSVSFLTEGAFNKIYSIKVGSYPLIMRVSLPVDPQHKTLSEFTTIRWTQRHTSLPVPRVIAYDSSQENLIGFEWILMEQIPGKCLADAWRGMEYEAKERLVCNMAYYSEQLSRNQLRAIGNIYPDSLSKRSGANAPPKVKRIVSMQFFWGNHIMLQDVPRGPFHSSNDWMSSYLSLSEHDCIDVLHSSSDIEDVDIEDAQRTLRIIRRLKSYINEFFPDDECGQGEHPEASVLYHDDLSMHNILVDDHGNLTGVVDWECVSALPLWKACYYPFFPTRST